MKTKNLFAVILGIAFLALAFLPAVSASDFYFQANSSASSLTVTQGDIVDLIMVASSHNNIPVSSEKLEAISGSNTYLIQNWNEPGTNPTGTSTYIWSKNYALDSSILGVGTFTLKFSATTNVGVETSELTLVVLSVDNVAPAITILGNNPESVLLGSTYTDAGATAMDNVDGDLTSSIITINNVNTNVVGTYYVNYSVTDNAGNTATAVRTVNVVNNTDLNAPNVTISSPVDGSTYSTTITDITYVSTDAEGNLFECWYSVDGGITNSTHVSCVDGAPNLFTGLSSVLGLNNWTVYASDTFGNIGSATVHFTINDTTAPVITPVDPLDGDDLDYTDVTLIVTLNEAGSVSYSIDGGANVSMNETSPLQFESDLLDLADEQYHNVTYYATDLAGNTANLTITFYVDEVVTQTNSTYDSDSGFTAEFIDTNSTVTGDTINLINDDNGLNWFQRFINWLCRVFGLEEIY